MLIMKFGGTSVSSKNSVEVICNLVEANINKNPVIVVSALSKVTDSLVAICTKDSFSDAVLDNIYNKHAGLAREFLIGNDLELVLKYTKQCLNDVKNKLSKLFATSNSLAPLALKDEIVFYGEKMSSFLIATIIHNITKIDTRQILSSTCIVTNKKFGSADYLATSTKKNTRFVILPLIKQNVVPVVTGFAGATKDGEITTLGRGGSDYSASILGFALEATEIQIWTDVDGVYSTDPRVIKTAKLLPLLAYEEASELANLGAKVLHPRTITPAMLSKIPVKVLNTFNPNGIGTTIVDIVDEKKRRVKAITTKNSVPLITIKSNDMLFGKGFLKKVFDIFARFSISISLISVSEVSISITLENKENINEVLKQISKIGMVTYNEDYGSLSLVGGHIMDTPNLMNDIFTILEAANIKVHMISYSGSNINVSMVILSRDINRALELLHNHFIG